MQHALQRAIKPKMLKLNSWTKETTYDWNLKNIAEAKGCATNPTQPFSYHQASGPCTLDQQQASNTIKSRYKVLTLEYLVMKIVVHRNLGSSILVDPVHVRVEGGPVAIVVVVAVRDEQVRVDHLVEESLDEVLARPQLQEWDTESEKMALIREIGIKDSTIPQELKQYVQLMFSDKSKGIANSSPKTQMLGQ